MAYIFWKAYSFFLTSVTPTGIPLAPSVDTNHWCSLPPAYSKSAYTVVYLARRKASGDHSSFWGEQTLTSVFWSKPRRDYFQPFPKLCVASDHPWVEVMTTFRSPLGGSDGWGWRMPPFPFAVLDYVIPCAPCQLRHWAYFRIWYWIWNPPELKKYDYISK